MKSREQIKIKSSRKSVQEIPSPKMNIKLSNKTCILSKNKLSISPRKKVSSNNTSLKEKINYLNYKKKILHKHISMKHINRNKYKFYKPFQMNMPETQKQPLRRKSIEMMESKTKKFFKMYSLEDKEKIRTLLNDNYNDILIEPILNNPIIELENNIKKVLNNMRLEIEKQKDIYASDLIDTNIIPHKEKNKLSSTPDLKFVFKKKKSHIKNKGTNTFIPISFKDIKYIDLENSLLKKITLKRSHSLEFSDLLKKRIYKRMKVKLNKKSIYDKYEQTEIIEEYSEENINTENSKGFSFHPNSTYIFIFEIIIIFANLYSFIFIPLRIAKNEDMRGSNTLFDEIIIYLIDIIYFMDIIIFFFKGYFNHEMEIIRNNKKIIIHYLLGDFFMDILEAFPLNYIIYLCNKKHNYFIYSDYNIIFLKLLAFVKPFKIFKITKKKNNIALEDFFENFNNSYRLETFIEFFISFLIFFLFVHLFICLHIFFTLQNYPNWITHINLADETFSTKYITSFYFLMTTMTTVGYGDIVCISLIERIFHIILIAIGTIIYTFLVSKIGNYLRDQSHEQTKLINDLNILETIRVSCPTMPFKLYFQIKSHLLNISKKRKKTGLSLLINGIPETIKNDLLFKIYAKEINKFSIFKNVNNSNFILQILTSFIPITMKKEEILLLEGEFIENIIFVKDGRLSMEMAVDLKDPYKSIQRYLELNFMEISKKEIESPNNIKRIKTMYKLNKDYKQLKAEIDNFLFEKQRTLNNNNTLMDTNNSFNLGKIDFAKKESDLNRLENYEIVKIFDVRKNENFGEVHMFLQKPSPFTLKAKSRIAEILLLRKNEAINISNNFPNIWRNKHNKSYHNLISLKHLAFKTLNQYYNSHFYHKHIKDHNFGLNLDTSGNDISFLERPSFAKKIANNERLNLIKPPRSSKIINKDEIKEIKTIKAIFNNNLFKGKEDKRKASAKTLIAKSGIKNESIISSNISSFNITDSIVRPVTNFIPKDIDRINNNDNEHKINNNLNYSKQNTYEKSRKESQKINNEENEKNIISDKRIINIKSRLNSDKNLQNNNNNNNTSIDYYKEIIKSINGSRKENDKVETLVNKKTIKFDKSSNNIINFSNEEDIDKIKEKIFTLKDVNENFSKKIRKKIKKRQKIERMRYSFEYQRKENNKNLVELYSNIIAQKLNPILRDNYIYHISPTLHNNIAEELINATFSKCNTQPFTEMMDSSSSEEINQKIFDLNSLKTTLSESFEIKSSYKNINILSKGEIIRNANYKKILENLIKANSKNKIFNNKEFKAILLKSQKNKNKETNNNRHSTGNNLNANKIASNGNISLIHNDKIQSISSQNINNYFSNKNVKNNKLNKIYNKDESNKININKNDLHKDNKKVNQNNLETLNNNINNSTINNNKSYVSSLNMFNEFDKDNIPKSENKLKFLNKNYEVNNSSINNSCIHKEDIKESKCIIV